jgi:hypothetical protein
LGEGKYYTLTSATVESDELLLTRLGANDPDFNLRRDAALMIRRKDSNNTIFVSVIEPHGSYSPVSELSVNSNSNIAEVKVVLDETNYTAVVITDVNGDSSLFILSNVNASAKQQHQVKIDGKLYSWTGPYHYTDSK